MAKKKLLYIAPDHLDFYKVILYGFENFTDYDVTLLLSNYTYKYKNVLEKILNSFSKFFFNKNLKKIKFNKHYTEIINKYDKFDVLFINRADIFTPEILTLLSKKANYSIANYWDSFEKIKGQKETMKYFDICYSFDKKDCSNYNLVKTNNFYYITDSQIIPNYDIFFLGTYDSRFEKLKNIVSHLEKQNIRVHAKLFSKSKKIIRENSTNNISFFWETIPFPESYKYNQNTNIILDISHNNQSGLSFRPFEALGLKKKLITTNPKIIEYDFYNPNNIFIWEDDTTIIPKSFFDTPYVNIPDAIYDKYSLKNWVNEILPKNIK